jgi:hypothetical protein
MQRKNEKMNSQERMTHRIVFGLVASVLAVSMAVVILGVKPATVRAWATPPCDFLTGGGWIVHSGAKANFAVAGGCKNGSPTWGHLEYIDHASGLNVHWTSITGYFFIDEGTGTDPQTHQPTGTRGICGTARTNLYGDVNFAVRAEDLGEPGVNDQFDIRLTDPATGTPVYDTTTECFPHYLGSSAPCSAGNGGGGDIQLHKPNPSTSGSFGGSCPAFPAFAGQ